MSKLKDINFSQLSKEEHNRIEESIYEMMAKFKKTPLELNNPMPKELNSLIENKWHYCPALEKKIRESTLENLILDLKNVEQSQISAKVPSIQNNAEEDQRS